MRAQRKLHAVEEVEREVRRREADWEYIRSLPPKLRRALELYVEVGDEYKAAKLASLTLDEFEELRMRARIPKVVVREEP
ncbi:MAG: hypothetical protein J7L75_05045 [Thermoproteales archaeon]|nr:hypothetical protein [Thermoproteales archaeon]